MHIFSCPKEFVGEFLDIQKLTLSSWKQISTNITYLGKDSIDYCQQNNINNVSIEYEDNTPLINSIFKKCKDTELKFSMYINADIILIQKQNLVVNIENIYRIFKSNFICVGERYEMYLNKNYSLEYIKKEVCNKGVNSGRFAIDYQIFSKDLKLDLPKLYCGIPGWDDYLLQYCKENSIIVIDISNVLLAVHADHHCRGKSGWIKSWYGEKSKINRSYIKGHIHSLDDADYIVDTQGNLIKGGKIKRYTDIKMAINNRLEMFRDSIEEEKYMDAIDHWNLVCMRDPKKKYVSEENKKLFSEVLKKLGILPVEFMMEANENLEKQVKELKKLNILWRLHIIDNLKDVNITTYLDNLRKEFPKNLLVYRKINWKNKTEMYNKVIQNMPNKSLLFRLYQYFLHTQIEGIRKSFLNNENAIYADNQLGKFVYRYEPGYKWSRDEIPVLLDTEDREI
jgi:hypothetical protein